MTTARADNVGLMRGQGRKRWGNIKIILGERLVFPVEKLFFQEII